MKTNKDSHFTDFIDSDDIGNIKKKYLSCNPIKRHDFLINSFNRYIIKKNLKKLKWIYKTYTVKINNKLVNKPILNIEHLLYAIEEKEIRMIKWMYPILDITIKESCIDIKKIIDALFLFGNIEIANLFVKYGYLEDIVRYGYNNIENALSTSNKSMIKWILLNLDNNIFMDNLIIILKDAIKQNNKKIIKYIKSIKIKKIVITSLKNSRDKTNRCIYFYAFGKNNNEIKNMLKKRIVQSIIKSKHFRKYYNPINIDEIYMDIISKMDQYNVVTINKRTLFNVDIINITEHTKVTSYIHHEIDRIFIQYCSNNMFEEMVNHVKKNKHLISKNKIEEGLIKACINNNWDMIYWLIKKTDINPNFNSGQLFETACRLNRLSIANKLYKKIKVNIRINNDRIFKNICKNYDNSINSEKRHAYKIVNFIAELCDDYYIKKDVDNKLIINWWIGNYNEEYQKFKKMNLDEKIEKLNLIPTKFNSNYDEECVVCCNTSNVLSNCNHSYCIDCFIEWFVLRQNEKNCCICREDIIFCDTKCNKK